MSYFIDKKKKIYIVLLVFDIVRGKKVKFMR